MVNTENNVETGAFLESLKRNNSKIRDDRATTIHEDAQIIYKRKMEDLSMSLKKMRREQENMLDLSPTSADSLLLASDFDAEKYVGKDLDLAVKIRNTEIKIEVGVARYSYLFGEELTL